MLLAYIFFAASDPTPSTPTATAKPLMSTTAWIVMCVLIIIFGIGIAGFLCWYFRCSRRKDDDPPMNQPVYRTFE